MDDAMPRTALRPARPEGALTIASYNIRKAVGLDWRRNPQRILAVIRELQADIVLLQEADRRLGDRPSALPVDLIGRETGLRALRPAHAGPSLGYHGNAVLVRPEIEALAVDPLDLPGLEPRGALSARLRLPDGQTLRVTGAHLGLRRANRRPQLTRLLAFNAEQGEQAQLLAGDFNEWSMNEGLGRVTYDFDLISPGPSFHASWPVALLDRFAIRGVTMKGAGVHHSALARKASDHLPIWSYVTLDSAAD